MAILNRFLRFLEWLEQYAELAAFLTQPIGLTLLTCLFSYQALLLSGCNTADSAVLASVVALALHCIIKRPEF
ncbi:MAG: hypothetical protein ACFB0C_11995 [Leptolyngbyaceae cyanobacterium]